MARTDIDFSKHTLEVITHPGVSIHRFKLPDTTHHGITFINTEGIMAVTGDYGNWIFCREFHPSPGGHVDDSYWKEKLIIASTQQPEEFDPEGTKEDIERLLQDDITEDEREYLEECLSLADGNSFDYEAYAYRENVGRFSDYESVPHSQITLYWLRAIFDAFDEICARLLKDVNKQESKYGNRKWE